MFWLGMTVRTTTTPLKSLPLAAAVDDVDDDVDAVLYRVHSSLVGLGSDFNPNLANLSRIQF